MKQGVIIAGSGRGSAFAQRIIREGRRRVVAIVDTNMEIHEKLRNCLLYTSDAADEL